MKTFTRRIAPVAFAATLALGAVGCAEDEGGDVDTEVDEGSAVEEGESEMEEEMSEAESEMEEEMSEEESEG